MFRAIILPIFTSTRLCVTACGIMYPRFCRPVTSWVYCTTSCNTQSSAPEDGQNNSPKNVELTGIINKLLLLHLVASSYLYQWCTVKQISVNEIYLLIKYTKSVLWRVVKRLSYTEDARCLKVNRASVSATEIEVLRYAFAFLTRLFKLRWKWQKNDGGFCKNLEDTLGLVWTHRIWGFTSIDWGKSLNHWTCVTDNLSLILMQMLP